MDIVSDKKLRKNIIQWYPIDKEKEILQIGYIEPDIIFELCNKAKNVTIFVSSEEEKNKINMYSENLKIEVIQDFENESNYKYKYDYVTLIGTLESLENVIEKKAYRRLEKLLKIAKQSCKDDGKIILVVDNKYGMKAWTTLKADRNIICNQTYAISKKLINKLLEEQDLNESKYYYILPDYRGANAIFTDSYMPDLESINRNFMYGDEKFENFNQTEAYIELLKEDSQSFAFFANSFFVEIGKNKLEENEIKFVSYTNIRKEKYKIQTIIYNDRVEKKCANEESKKHIINIGKNIEIMNNKQIKTLDKYEDGKIISKYIENSPSYDKVLVKLLQNMQNDEFFNSIQRYKMDLLSKLEEIEIEKIKNNTIFDKYKIDCSEEIMKKMHFIKYGLWDLIFHNAFYIDKELYFYDQEWIEYNVPIEFIIYRAIAYFPIAHSFIKTEELYKRLELEEYLEIFRKLDAKLQEEIRDEEIWNQHLSTQTGQTLLNLYQNLTDELNNYKLAYNQEINNAKQNEIEEKQHIIEDLKKKVEELNSEKEKIYNSNSWKITKPIRWLGRNLK